MLGTALAKGWHHRITLLVLHGEFGNTVVFYSIYDLHQIANAVATHRITELHLSFDLVALRNGYLPHVVAETAELPTLPVMPARRCTHPYIQALLDTSILPMANNHLSVQPHSRHDETKLTVAMCALIKVHKIHIDGRPRNVAIELRVKMQQRLLQYLQSTYPHLCGRERVHPGYDADAVFGRVGVLAELVNFFGRFKHRLED